MQERVQKIIANSGFCSRRKAEEYIEKGVVTVNDKKITLGDKADSKVDTIKVDGKKIQLSRKMYIVLNKPKHVVTTLSDPQGRKKVTDLIRSKERLIPVGRLDMMTEGLILLTNDGEFANKVAHPRYEVQKKYQVQLEQPLTDEAERFLKKGVILDGARVKPDKVSVSKNGLGVFITLHSGKNRVIRSMFDVINYKIVGLARIGLGPIKLDLEPGKYRPLTQKEIDYFLK